MRKNRFAPSDFTYLNLPHSRRAQFFDLLKTRFSLVAQIGGVLLLFSLPFLAAYAFNNIGLIPYAEANYSGEELSSFLATNEFIFSVVYSICFIVMALGLSGLVQIIKKYAWGQGIYFWHDFGKGFKQNAAYFATTSFIFGLLYIGATLLGGIFSNAILANIPDAVLLLFLPFFMIVLVNTSIYSGSYGRMWGNAFSLFARYPTRFLLFMLFPFSVLFIELIPYPVICLAAYFLIVLLLIPLYAFAFFFFCLAGLDRYTNVNAFPSYYHRGLFDEFDEAMKKSSMMEDSKNRNRD